MTTVSKLLAWVEIFQIVKIWEMEVVQKRGIRQLVQS